MLRSVDSSCGDFMKTQNRHVYCCPLLVRFHFMTDSKSTYYASPFFEFVNQDRCAPLSRSTQNSLDNISIDAHHTGVHWKLFLCQTFHWKCVASSIIITPSLSTIGTARLYFWLTCLIPTRMHMLYSMQFGSHRRIEKALDFEFRREIRTFPKAHKILSQFLVTSWCRTHCKKNRWRVPINNYSTSS